MHWIAFGIRQEIRDLINESVPDSLVEGYESIAEALTLPDPSDFHILDTSNSGFFSTENGSKNTLRDGFIEGNVKLN